MMTKERFGLLIIIYMVVVLLIMLFCIKEPLAEDISFEDKYIIVEKIPDTCNQYIGVDNRGNVYYLNSSSKKAVMLFMYDDITDNMIRSLREGK